MTDDDGISRRTALGSIALTGVAAAGGGAGTFAYLTDSSTTDAIFETGSLVLDTSPPNGELKFESLEEGETNTSEIAICNTGSLPVRNVILDGISISGETEVAKAIKVSHVTYEEEIVTGPSKIGDPNSNGISDIHDLKTWLDPDGRSLTDSTNQDGLSSNDGDGECNSLIIKTEMDYSVLPDDLTDNAEVTVSVDLIGKQESL